MEGVRATREEVKRFLSVEKYYRGCGFGYGSGYGSGYGYVSGKSSYDGCGFGYGSGYGAGYKDGNGYGSSLSYEDGYSSGPGFGFGYGNGDVTALNGNIVDYIDNKSTIITQVHGNFAKGYIVKDDLSLDSCFIAKVGNLFTHGKTLKDAVTKAGTKIKKISIEEQIENFIAAFGPLDSEHKGKAFYDWHHILTGSCRVGRDKFCKSHKIDLKQKYSVRYFLDITKKSYGKNIIKLIEKAYKEIED